MAGAQGQSGNSSGQTGTSGSSSDSSPSGSSTSSADKSSWQGRSSKGLSPTGRMSHHEIQASQLNGSSVQSSSGETLGTINDVIINPASGRVDFALLSVTGSTGSTGTSSTSSTASTSSSSGKQV